MRSRNGQKDGIETVSIEMSIKGGKSSRACEEQAVRVASDALKEIWRWYGAREGTGCRQRARDDGGAERMNGGLRR